MRDQALGWQIGPSQRRITPPLTRERNLGQLTGRRTSAPAGDDVVSGDAGSRVGRRHPLPGGESVGGILELICRNLEVAVIALRSRNQAVFLPQALIGS